MHYFIVHITLQVEVQKLSTASLINISCHTISLESYTEYKGITGPVHTRKMFNEKSYEATIV